MNNIKQSVKNYQDEETIKSMYKKSFKKDANNITISKLSGGMKNAVYLVNDDSKKVVLKIAPQDESKMIYADRDIIWWETEMLKKMENIKFPSPKLLYYDDSLEVCNAPYFFMSFLDGKNYSEIKDGLSDKEKSKIEYKLGVLSRKICNIKGDSFFLPSHPYMKFNDNYEFVYNLFNLLLYNAKNEKLDLGVNTYNTIENILNLYQDELKNISNLCLTHTDIWDGNILVKDGEISGVVDFSDLYYCDELMTFYFHTIDGKTSKHFLSGFDKKELSNDEKIRIEIYRMYVILKMIVDCKLKGYGKFDWMYDNLNTRINTLKKVKNI